MGGLFDTIFGPLVSSDFCLWFLFLSILGFIWLFFYLVSAIYLGIVKRKGSDYWMTMIAIALGYAIFYGQNRLLHTMCSKSLSR